MKLQTLPLIILAAFALVPTDTRGEIYKTIDEDGNVVFTDIAPPNISETVELSNSTSYTPPATPASPTTGTQQPIGAPAASAQPEVIYQSILINAPANDEAVRDNAGNITISVEVKPSLAPGHSIALVVDGKRVSTSVSGQFPLRNVDRGTHTLSAQVLDENQMILKQSSDQTFHMLRYSALFLQRGN